MIIDNLTATEVFVEKKMLIKITADSINNSNGKLEIDDNKNKLISVIDSGDTRLYRVSKYKGTDNIMFYNSTRNQLCLAKEGDLLNINIDFDKGLQYFVGAKKIICKSHINNQFDCNLEGLNVFKIFLDNGRELTSYTTIDNKIIILGNDRYYIDDFSELVVYVYVSESTKPSLMSKVDYTFQVEFYGYEVIFDINEMIGGTYFETFKGDEISLFDSLEVAESVNKDVSRGHFAVSSYCITNSIENSVDLQTFIGDEAVDLPQYVGNEEFRIICLNSSFGRMVLINNCRINDGVSAIFTKERNSKKYKIDCGNYIDINLYNSSFYGLKRYGRGQYGDGTLIYNSARRGAKFNDTNI